MFKLILTKFANTAVFPFLCCHYWYMHDAGVLCMLLLWCGRGVCWCDCTAMAMAMAMAKP